MYAHLMFTYFSNKHMYHIYIHLYKITYTARLCKIVHPKSPRFYLTRPKKIQKDPLYILSEDPHTRDKEEGTRHIQLFIEKALHSVKRAQYLSIQQSISIFNQNYPVYFITEPCKKWRRS